jgi:hypothetical protein
VKQTTDRQTDRQIVRQTDRQTGEDRQQTDRQTDRQIVRQTDRQIGALTHNAMQLHKHTLKFKFKFLLNNHVTDD